MSEPHWSDSWPLLIAFTLAFMLAFCLIPDEDAGPVRRANSSCAVLKGMAGTEGSEEWQRMEAECASEGSA